MLCSNCGEKNSKGKFCCECGSLLSNNEIYNSDIEEVEKEYIQSEIQIDNTNEEFEDIIIEAEVHLEEIIVEPIVNKEETFIDVQVKDVDEYVNVPEEAVINDESSSGNVNFVMEPVTEVPKVENLAIKALPAENKLMNAIVLYNEAKKEPKVEEENVISKLKEVFEEKEEEGSNIELVENKETESNIAESNVEEVEEVEEFEEVYETEDEEEFEEVDEFEDDFEEIDDEDDEEENFYKETKKVNKSKKNAKKSTNKIKNNNKMKKESKNKSKKGAGKKSGNKKKIIFTVGVAIIALMVGAMAFKPIKANYYLKKMDSASLQVEKVQYASQAVEVLNSAKTRTALETALEGTIETNIKLVDSKLEEMSLILPEEDYKSLAEKIKNLEVNYYCDNNEYKDAIIQLEKINDLGANFKKNINYSDMMLYSINNLIDSSVEKVDTVITGKSSTIVKENIDDDNFEELLNIEKGTSSGEIKISLFKYVDGKYSLANELSIANSSYSLLSSTEVYYYNVNESAVYITYKDSSNNIIISVINASDNKLKIKNTVKCGKYAFIQDIDNDGRYEIGSSKTSSSDAETWYKLNEDGTTSVLDLNKKNSESSTTNDSSSNNSSTTTNTTSNSDDSKTNTDSAKDNTYIFADSNSRYLTESDLAGLSKSQLSFARNEIFARYGYVFSSQEYTNYFNKKSWYKANASYSGGNETLNEYEKANVELIRKYEEN